VLLEGLEVAFIVVTFGAAENQVGLAALGAVAALVIVLVAGVILHRPLSRVPENTLKLSVGLLLASFGTFWAGEGVGVEWPGSDLAILAILVLYFIVSLGYIWALRRQRQVAPQTIS
jgi:uncharacterized membrane protein